MSEREYKWAAYSAFDTFGQGEKITEGTWPVVPLIGDVIEVRRPMQLRPGRYRVLTRTWTPGGAYHVRLTLEDLEP